MNKYWRALTKRCCMLLSLFKAGVLWNNEQLGSKKKQHENVCVETFITDIYEVVMKWYYRVEQFESLYAINFGQGKS